jgi:membrane-associated protein
VSDEPRPAAADVSAPPDPIDEAATGEAATGEAATGEAATGDAATGDAATDDAATDEAAGDTAIGDTTASDAATGDTTASDATVASPWNDPRLPWEGKPRRVDVVCWAAITLSGLYYLCLLPFRASLVGTHPLVLVLLNGSTEGIVSAAAFARVGHGSVGWILLASVPGLMKFDIIYWWAGRLWGERVILLFSGRRKHGAKFMDRVQRWGAWFTWPAVLVAQFLPIPNAIVYAVAGWAGMNLATFLILDAISSLAWAGMLTALGYALGQHAVSVAQAVSKYGLWVSIGIVVLVFASQLRGMRAQRLAARAY